MHQLSVGNKKKCFNKDSYKKLFENIPVDNFISCLKAIVFYKIQIYIISFLKKRFGIK